MATIVLRTYNVSGATVRMAEFKGSKNIDPMTAMDKAEGKWKTFSKRNEVWIDMFVDGKLVTGCDLS